MMTDADKTSLSGKTILQVIPDLSAGGAERTTLEIAQALIEAGATALVASAGGRLEAELKDIGGLLLKRETLPSKNPIDVFKNYTWLTSIIASHSVDILHARSRASAWSSYWAAQKTKTPFVTTFHGAYNGKTAPKRWYNSVMARGDSVIANSSYIAEHIALTYPQYSNRIITIPRGVDLDTFHENAVSQERKAALIKEWFDGIKPDHALFLLPGRLTAWKGQKQAIEALSSLKSDTSPPFTLIIAGDAQGRDEYKQSLIDLIAKLDMSSHVKLVGHCSDMPAALSLADAVLAPSQEPEAFGRVAAEAGAFGLPVIVCDHGGQREIVVDGITGFRVKPGNIDALSTAARRVLSLSSQQKEDLKQKAKAHIRSSFSTKSLQKATLDVYRNLLERQTSPDA